METRNFQRPKNICIVFCIHLPHLIITPSVGDLAIWKNLHHLNWKLIIVFTLKHVINLNLLLSCWKEGTKVQYILCNDAYEFHLSKYALQCIRTHGVLPLSILVTLPPFRKIYTYKYMFMYISLKEMLTSLMMNSLKILWYPAQQ